MADPFAVPDDVADRWRPLTSAESSTASALLQDASARIRSQYPGIDDQIASGAVDEDAVTAVATAMVIRAMISRGAAGASQVSEAAGPFSQSFSFANPNGNLYLTADDDALIRGYWPAARSIAYDTS